MGLIYLDSCILIYALEDPSPRGDVVRTKLSGTEQVVATSPLVLHECLVGPLKTQNLELRQHYIDIFASMYQIEIDSACFLLAAEIRALHGLRTPDALHLAATQLAGCDELWTNDRRFANSSRGLAVNILE